MCCPSQEIRETYELQGDSLVQLSHEEKLPAAAADLLGKVWRWEAYSDGKQDDVVVPSPENYLMEFSADGSFDLRADCNLAAGSYVVDGQSITLQPGPTTLAECPPGSLYDQYLALLSQVAEYGIEGDHLLLRLVGGGMMTFAAMEEIAGK